MFEQRGQIHIFHQNKKTPIQLGIRLKLFCERLCSLYYDNGTQKIV